MTGGIAALAIVSTLAVVWVALLCLFRSGLPTAGRAPGRPRPQRRGALIGARAARGGVEDAAVRTRGRRNGHSIVISVLSIVVTGALIADMSPHPAATYQGSLASGSPSAASAAHVPPGDPPLAGARLREESASDAVVLAVGDLTECPNQDRSIPALASRLPGTILAVGDIVDPDGSQASYESCYEPLWHDLKSRMWAVPGNHDYATESAAAPFYAYFGARGGDPGKGYYTFDLGAWRIFALNSVCPAVNGCDTGSAQATWLAKELARDPAECILAFWHHPLRSSGNGGSDRAATFWQLLYEAGADVVVNGHDHHYERFAPMGLNGSANPDNGLRQFTVGTGGGSLTPAEHIAPNSEVRSNASHGLLQLTLKPGGYDWQFVPADEGGFTDSGNGDCSSGERNQ